MATQDERLDNNWKEARSDLVAAARTVGIDPGIVAKIAGFESGFDERARPIARDASRNSVRQFDGVMAISSAHGYGQFLNGTWANMIREYGERHGVVGAAQMSDVQANAPALRNDRSLQAAMLAEFTHDNMERGARLGGPDPDANVYAFHNLGQGDAARFLAAMRSNAGAEVGTVLSPQVIRGNPSLYGDGSRTLAQAYAAMGRHMDRYERFAIDARREGLQVDAGDRGLPPQVTGPRDSAAAGAQRLSAPIEQGQRAEAVRSVQRSLISLGYRDANGRPLVVDGDFGPRTRQAVEAFQRDSGLPVDGVVGPRTLGALERAQQTPLLSHPTHPDHALYRQALRGIEQLPASTFRSDVERRNAAATLAFEARVSGASRIDHVVLSQRGDGLFAVHGALGDPAHLRVYADRAQAAGQPVERSTALLRDDAAQRQALLAQAQPVATRQAAVEPDGPAAGPRP